MTNRFQAYDRPLTNEAFCKAAVRAALIIGVAMVLLFAGACSNAPAGPQPGTPAFYWAAAGETWKAGDYVKTSEHLQRILSTDNEYGKRARVWDTVISSGLAQGYIELADVYEAGARANRNNPTPFRKEISTLRSLASSTAIQYTEDMHKLDSIKDAEIPLAFPFPAGSAAQPAALKRISGGIIIQDTERDMLLTAMLQRGVVLSACAAAGTPDDAAAAQEKLKTGDAKVARDAFLLAQVRSMQSESDLFTGTKLDQPARLKMMSQEALEVLKALPPGKETKQLDEKIRARMKKANIT